MSRRRRTPLSDLDLVRSRGDVWTTGDGSARAEIILVGRHPARYMRVSSSTASALDYLARQPLGVPVHQMRSRFPGVNVDALADRWVVDVLPVPGVRPSVAMVAELWFRNVAARIRIATHGWSALERRMSRPANVAPPARPVLLDEIEAAARRSFALPGTSRRCTVVALAIYGMLNARGATPRLVVLAETEGIFMHSYVVIGNHVVDPGDSLLEGTTLRAFGPA